MNAKALRLITELRHVLHENAELSGNEYKTQDILKRFLKENTRLEIHEENGYFYAHIPGGVGKKIALRADMDAVSIPETIALSYSSFNYRNVSHKCGHDGHMAVICAAALELAESKKNLYFLFQPSEEDGKGAVRCLEFLRLNNIDEIYGFHNIPGEKLGRVLLKKGTFACTSEGITVSFKGKTTHAAYPELGINPSYAIGKLLTSIEKLTNGNITSGLSLCTIINVQSGEKNFGISAGEGSVSVTVRAEYEEDMLNLKNGILKAAAEISDEYGVVYSSSVCDYFPATLNSDESIDKLEKILVKADCKYLDAPMRWSEDFGYYLRETRGAYIGIGSGEKQCGLHTAAYDFPDALIEPAAEIFKKICTEA